MEVSHVVLCFEELQSELNLVKDVVKGVGEHDGQCERAGLTDQDTHTPTQAVWCLCKNASSYGLWAEIEGVNGLDLATEAVTPEVLQCQVFGVVDDLQAHTAADFYISHQAFQVRLQVRTLMLMHLLGCHLPSDRAAGELQGCGAAEALN